jgi:uncharacterized HAD superfamily protein
MAIIKIDVDGVLRNSFQTMCDVYNRDFDTNMTTNDITDYNCSVSFPLIEQNMDISANEYFFWVHADEVFLGPAYPGAAESIKRLHDAGNRIEICSYQPSVICQRLTLDFLEREKILYDGIHFTSDKWLVKSDYIIDDNPDFITDEREEARKICITHPFNKHILVIRADNIVKAADLIIKMERQK